MSDIERIEQKLDSYIEHNDKYHEERDIEFKEMKSKIDEIHQLLTAANLAGRAAKIVAGFIVTVGSAYLLVKEIFFDK